MKRIILILILALSLSSAINAQKQGLYKKNESHTELLVQKKDSTSLSSAFKRSHFNGHIKYFFMATDNENGLTDYYANAIGAGLRFETAKFHNFQFAISGASIFNIGSSDLTKPDTLTNQYDRYEVGLYDITNLSNKKDINHLEEVYLKYNFKNSFISLGKQFINTPFINLQDGRMNTTAVEGIYTEVNEVSTLKLQLGWLWNISPRSTTGWYKIDKSVGIYPSGINPDGTKSQYSNNIKSDGIAILGITKEFNKNIKLQGWNMFTENVFNTSMIQANISIPIKKKSSLLAAAQIIRQDALNYGGNTDQSKTYFAKRSHSLSFGANIGWKNKQWEVSINYNRITNSGRYLMPREWGREPFFTFLPRERNEGLGNVNAFMAKINYNTFKGKVLVLLATGYYQLPDVKDYPLNKYSLPSYTQVNADIRYIFTKSLKGLEAEILLVNKINCGKTYNNKKFIFNKVNMQQYNFVLNYHF